MEGHPRLSESTRRDKVWKDNSRWVTDFTKHIKKKAKHKFSLVDNLKTLTLLIYILKLVTGAFSSVHNSRFRGLSSVWKFTHATLFSCTLAQLLCVFGHSGTLYQYWTGWVCSFHCLLQVHSVFLPMIHTNWTYL